MGVINVRRSTNPDPSDEAISSRRDLYLFEINLSRAHLTYGCAVLHFARR